MPNAQDRIKHRHHAAYWYAHGRIDEDAEWTRGKASGSYPNVDPTAFAAYASNEAKALEEGRTSFLPSVMDQWANYLGRDHE